MISGVFIATVKGDILLSRYFRNDVNETISQLFKIKVIIPDNEDAPPVTHVHSVSFLHIKVDDLYVVAVTGQNSNSLVVFEFLKKLVEILRAYFGGKFNSKKIKNYYALIHELLEEILDFGYPQVTDAESLKIYITQGRVNATKLKDEKIKKLNVVATGQTPWRPPDITYKRNELWIDVIEKINLLVSHQGVILKSDVEGEIKLKCHLSGMPQCEFGMNDKILLEKEKSKGKKVSADSSIALDDLSFHQCVRLSSFENDRIVSFVPPDGEFTLMRYRSTERITLPYRILSQLKYVTDTRLDYEVTLVSEYPPKVFGIKVTVKIPTPPNTAVCKTVIKGAGKAKYDAQSGGIIWRIRRLSGHSEYTLRATVDLLATSVDKNWDRPPISMDFTVPMFAASGLKIKFLRVIDKSGYVPSKWVRYMTKGGAYQRRL